MKKTIQLTLTTIQEIQRFVFESQKLVGDVLVKKGKFIVDGKSLMGVISIDPSSPILVEYPDDEPEFEVYLASLN